MTESGTRVQARTVTRLYIVFLSSFVAEILLLKVLRDAIFNWIKKIERDDIF